MVEVVGSVRDVQVDRIRPPEPQPQQPVAPSRFSGGDGEATPPNGIALLADTSSAALLRVQEADDTATENDTGGNMARAREDLQKLLDRHTGDRAASDVKATADRIAQSLDANRIEDAAAGGPNTARSQARGINIGA